jgi:hypothetical protein
LKVYCCCGVLTCRRDWGFVICASDLLDAMASFDDRLKETLVLSAEAGDTLSEGDESMQHSQRSSAHGGITSSSDSKPATGGLAGAFKRLQARVGLLRTQVRWTLAPRARTGGGVG